LHVRFYGDCVFLAGTPQFFQVLVRFRFNPFTKAKIPIGDILFNLISECFGYIFHTGSTSNIEKLSNHGKRKERHDSVRAGSKPARTAVNQWRLMSIGSIVWKPGRITSLFSIENNSIPQWAIDSEGLL
jgi:hypothetical protein